MLSRKAILDDPPCTPTDEQIDVVCFSNEPDQDNPGPHVVSTPATEETISESSDHPQSRRTEPAFDSNIEAAEKPIRARQLRCCARPLFPALEELAEDHQHYKPVLLEIAWRMHFPPSLRALPIVARNIWRSLVMLHYVFGVDLEELGVACWLGPLEWLASDSEVLPGTRVGSSTARIERT